MKTIMEEFSEIKKQTDELAKMAGYTEEEIHQDIQRMKEGVEKDEKELEMSRTGAEVEYCHHQCTSDCQKNVECPCINDHYCKDGIIIQA